MKLDAKGLHYKILNERLKDIIYSQKLKEIEVENVNGQRYICAGVKADVKVSIKGIAGNDLGAFMNGPFIEVYGNGQDGVGNTMNEGKIVIHGNSGDITGHAMRGGQIFVKGNVGYRVGIHMKEYQKIRPIIVIGGKAGSFLGEYMAGGIILLLNKNNLKFPVGDYVGTGMHGGVIYIRGEINEDLMGKEVKIFSLTKEDKELIDSLLEQYYSYFPEDKKYKITKKGIKKLIPYTHRPYGKLYAY